MRCLWIHKFNVTHSHIYLVSVEYFTWMRDTVMGRLGNAREKRAGTYEENTKLLFQPARWDWGCPSKIHKIIHVCSCASVCCSCARMCLLRICIYIKIFLHGRLLFLLYRKFTDDVQIVAHSSKCRGAHICIRIVNNIDHARLVK